MAKINIVDPGMHGYYGHHADINIRLARGFLDQGHEVCICGAKGFEPKSKDHDLSIQSIFSVNPYSPLARTSADISTLSPGKDDLVSRTFTGELGGVSEADVHIFPTLFAYQTHGIAVMRKRLGSIVAGLHLHPQWFGTNEYNLWRQGLREISVSRGEIFVLGCFEPELILEYENLLPEELGSVHQFPIPHDGVKCSPISNEVFTVGILGHQRTTKHIDRLEQTMRRLVSNEFNVVIQDSREKFGTHTNHEKVKVYGYVENIGSLIQRCDVVLLDYDARMYRYSGSGIAWEALASGVPILAPKGTTMSKLIRECRNGMTFDVENLESKFRCLNEMRTNKNYYKSEAIKASEMYHNLHGTENFINYIMHITSNNLLSK